MGYVTGGETYQIFISRCVRVDLTHHQPLGLLAEGHLCALHLRQDVSTRQVHEERLVLVIHDWGNEEIERYIHK